MRPKLDSLTHFSPVCSSVSKRVSERGRHVSRCAERGSEAVELAVILPVFIILIFGFIDVGRMVAGYSTVRAAAALGARFAVASQRTEWAAIPIVMGDAGDQNTKATITAGTDSMGKVPEFASSDGDPNWYLTQSDGSHQKLNNQLYRLEIRAIAYANKILADSIGSDVKYPCADQQGCFHCFTLRGDSSNYDRYFSVSIAGSTRHWISKTLAVQCTYYVPITTALVSMGILPSTIPITGRAYVPINDYAGTAYDPKA